MISTEEQRPGGPIAVPYIPDDLTVTQFMLDSHHTYRPQRPFGVPWFIDDDTGKAIGAEEVRAYTWGLANELHARFGIKENDVVSIFSTNHMHYPIVLWAVIRLGGILSCSNPTSTAEELAYQCNSTKPTLIVTTSELLETAIEAGKMSGVPVQRIVLIDHSNDPLRPSVTDLITEGLKRQQVFSERQLAPGEGKTRTAIYCFSSGTTGSPKAVIMSHYALIAGVLLTTAGTKANDSNISWDQRVYRPGDVALGVLPFYHIYGLAVFLLWTVFCGSTVVVVPRFNFSNMLKSVERYRITHLSIVPPMAVLLCKSSETQAHDLSSVRNIVCGAAPFSGELTERLSALFPDAHIGQGFGMTETCGAVAWTDINEKIGTLGCAGVLLPGVEARVIKQDGSDAKFGEEGQLLIRTPTASLGYLNNLNATKETFIDGWIYSGDEVVLNEKREIFVKDRIKEFLKVKGFQVAPAELEAHLHTHPDVGDVCVVGITDEYSGELPLAWVVFSAGAQGKLQAGVTTVEQMRTAIMKHVSDHKASYKHLAGIEFTDSIPKNPSGKLLRRLLRDKAKKLQTEGKLAIRNRSKL